MKFWERKAKRGGPNSIFLLGRLERCQAMREKKSLEGSWEVGGRGLIMHGVGEREGGGGGNPISVWKGSGGSVVVVCG